MQLGVNVPNFGPGMDSGVLRAWADTAEGLGLDQLMISDHVAVTPDVAEKYPEPFFEAFSTLSWLAGITATIRLGTTVVILPYRHPLLVARMADTIARLSGDRFVLGVGVGWAQGEFAALGVDYRSRGRITDEMLAVLRNTPRPGTATAVPIWIGGNSDAAIRRAERYGDAWHPLRGSVAWLRSVHERHPGLTMAPRIPLRLTSVPVDDRDRDAGVGTVDQVLGDLHALRQMGSDTVILDPYQGNPEETHRPQEAWQALSAVITNWRTAS